MIVVDASAMLEVLLRTPAAAAIEARIFQSGQTLHAPHLIDVEVAQVLRRHVLARQIDARQGEIALSDWLLFPIRRYDQDVLLLRAWELRDNMTAYDGVYVALAEALNVPLLTHDAKLAGAPGHSATIEIL